MIFFFFGGGGGGGPPALPLDPPMSDFVYVYVHIFLLSKESSATQILLHKELFS